jgi:hypothetical protein
MAPEGFGEFFLATAGAGAALIGLLFVAITIGPERTFGAPDRMGPPRQHLAEAALITMFNGFVVSCVALIPGVNVGWIAFIGGLWGVVTAVLLVRQLVRFHRHGATHHVSWSHLLRVTGVSLIAIVVYAVETLLGLQLIREPGAAKDVAG